MCKIKISIFYFSGTGNTWWVTTKLVERLQKEGYKVEGNSIESVIVIQKEKIEQILTASDIIGFGYPIYGSDIPENFHKFLKTLPKMEGKIAFVYTTMMLFSGDGAIVAKRLLKRKGFKVKQAINIRMPNNLKLPYPIFKRFPMHNGEENNLVKTKALVKIEKLVQKIISGKRWIQGADPFNIIGGLMQRVEMRIADLSVYARNYFVDKEMCTECMQCVETCPTNNIVFEDGNFIWQKSCILCLRCYNHCPEDAIQYKRGTLDRKRYPRYKGPGDNFSVAKLQK
ncbi:MAG: EFR1 family ferrodoxin [Candidatus Thorarchaeota archaeon]